MFTTTYVPLVEVQRLDLTMRKGIEIYDLASLSLPSTSSDRHEKMVFVDNLATGHSTPKGFKNFSTISPTKILFRAG